MKHRPGKQEFILREWAVNESISGLHVITLTGQIETLSGLKHSAVFTFEVHIWDCQVKDFDASPSEDAEYFLGSDKLIFGQYSFI